METLEEDIKVRLHEDTKLRGRYFQRECEIAEPDSDLAEVCDVIGDDGTPIE